jgi:hypothetical protein
MLALEMFKLESECEVRYKKDGITVYVMAATADESSVT